MAGQEALEGLRAAGDGLRAAGEGIKSFGQTLLAGLKAMGDGIKAFGVAAYEVGTICTQFMKQTARAHYNVFGKYTYPLEQEISQTHPPDPSELNYIGQGVLTIPIPITIISHLAALFVIPFFGNFKLSSQRAFAATTNIALLDSPEDQLPQRPDDRNFVRKYIYGLPGIAYGVGLGVIAAAGISIARLLTNTFISAMHSFVFFTNLPLNPNDQVEPPEDKRNLTSKLLFGGLGWLIGGSIGLVTAGLILTTRIAINSFKSMWRSIIDMMNLSLNKNDTLTLNPDTRDINAQRLGYPGYAIGAPLGLITAGFITVGRIIINSFKTACYSFINMLNLALTDNYKITTNDTRDVNAQRLGYPGYLIGVPFGLVAAGFALTGRAIIATCEFVSRIFSNSWETLSRSFKSILALSLNENDAKYIRPGDDTRDITSQRLGYPGYIIGAPLGLIAAGFALAGRVIINSCKTAWHSFADMIDLSLPDNYKLNLNDTRDINAKRLGYPGYILGVPFGLLAAGFTLVGRAALAGLEFIGRVFSNSLETLSRSFMSILALPLNENDAQHIRPREDTRDIASKRLGYPGYIFGVPFGLVAAGFAATGRVIINSCKTLWRSFLNTLALPLNENDAKNIRPNDDTRDINAQRLGYPGYVIGVPLGLVAAGFATLGRIIINSCKTAYYSFISMLNLPLTDNYKINVNDTRDVNAQRLGYPGYLVGVPFGLVAAGIALTGRVIITACVVVGRILSNSWETLSRSFRSILALPLNENDAKDIRPGADTRDSISQYLGYPGYVLGVPFGFVAAGFATLGRMLLNSCKTAGYSFINMLNMSLNKNDVITVDQDTRDTNAQRLGYPGYIIGTPLGLIAAGFATLGRIIINSCKTAWYSFINMLNLGLANKINVNDTRDLNAQRLGYPGYLMGVPVGLVAAGIALTGRIIIAGCEFAARVLSNSWETLSRSFKSMLALSLNENDAKNVRPGNDTRDITSQRLGYPGYIIGVPTGLIAAGFALVGRVIINSCKTAFRSFVNMMNLSLNANDAVNLGEDKRDINAQRLGYPGYIIGVPTGLIAAGFALVGRVIINSCKTAFRSFVNMMNLSLNANDAINLGEDKRDTNAQRLGYPGHIIGAPLGLIAAGFALAGRIIINTFKTTIGTCLTIVNAVLPKEMYLPADTRDLNAQRLGYPGIILGGLLAIVPAIVIGVGRFLNQTRLSAQAIGGSILNGGFERSVFGGLGADTRTWKQKLCGGLGYVIGAVIATPIAVAIWAIRKIPLISIASVFGLITSPIVALRKCCENKLFPENNNTTQSSGGEKFKNQADIIQGFKNIFSSLGAMGRLDPGGVIAANGTGNQTKGMFIRKCFTFNGDTVTERTLKKLLERYKQFDGHDEGGFGAQFFTSKSFNDAIQEVKDFYVDCFTRCDPYEIDIIHREIEKVAQLVRNYMLSHLNGEMQVRNDLYDNDLSWSAKFWGGNNNKVGEQAPPVPSAPSLEGAPASANAPLEVVTGEASPSSSRHALFTRQKTMLGQNGQRIGEPDPTPSAAALPIAGNLALAPIRPAVMPTPSAPSPKRL